MNDAVDLTFAEITRRCKALALPPLDWVVAIGRGGVIPAVMLAYAHDLPLGVLEISYRADDHTPKHHEPVLVSSRDLPNAPCRVLLVDDVSVSGATFAFALERLCGYHVTTFALKGRADLVAFPDVPECVNWPWKSIEAVAEPR